MAKTTELPLRAIRVLLVDDSGPIQRLMSHHLRNVGISVAVAVNGREGAAMALRSLREGRAFDLILMDLDMPKMTGYEALHRLRKRGYTGPVVALTANNLHQDIQRCREAGFNEHAEKPISKPILRELMARLIENQDSASD